MDKKLKNTFTTGQYGLMQIDVIETFMWSIMLESHVSPNSYRLNNKKIKNTLATGQYGLMQIDVIETFMLSIKKGRLAAAIHSTSQKKKKLTY